jgi:guanylate kinase
MRGNLIIISAPSGAGKTTLVGEALKRVPRVAPSVSYTARAPRPGEEQGAHYRFVSRAEFEAMIACGELLEWAEVHGNLYGTPRAPVEALLAAGNDVLLTIDVQGAEQTRRLFPASVSVFILPPSFQALLERLDKRGVNGPQDLQIRLRNALDELAHCASFTYVLINEDLEQAANELAAIIIAERCRAERRRATVESIRQTFKTS